MRCVRFAVEEESTTENTECTEKDGWAVGSLGELALPKTSAM